MEIKHLLFDLDNTLYPATAAMDAGITKRMLDFIANFLGVSYEQAVAQRKIRLPHYGTTLEWLRTEHNLSDVDEFFAAVHPPEEVEELEKDENLRSLLQSLSLPMTILTNAPMCHAKRVLEFLDVADLFSGIYDIQKNNFKGKPYPAAYTNAIEGAGFSIADTLFFDDHKKYTEGYRKLGGTAVLVCHPDVAKDSNLHPLDTATSADDNGTLQIASVYDVPALLERLTY